LNPELKLLGILLNLVEGRTTNIGEELEQVLRSDHGSLIFTAKLNKSIKVEESPMFHKSIMEYAPESKNALQFKAFIEEFLERLEND